MAEQLPEEVLTTLKRFSGASNKLRSAQEIHARYVQTLESYQKLCFTSGDVREQKVATHAEIKMLGWVLGKPDKDVIKDINAYSNRPDFPRQS